MGFQSFQQQPQQQQPAPQEPSTKPGVVFNPDIVIDQNTKALQARSAATCTPRDELTKGLIWLPYQLQLLPL